MVRSEGRKKRCGRARPPGKSSSRNALPDVYDEMLADAISSSSTRVDEEGPSVKRRRIRGRMVVQGNEGIDDNLTHDSDHTSTAAVESDDMPEVVSHHQQTAYNDSEESAESDVDWEEIDFGNNTEKKELRGDSDDGKKELKLVLDAEDPERRRQTVVRRKPATAEERRLRLEIHKMHLLSLIAHVHLRNHWCNDHEVQGALQSLLTKRNISYLNPDEQFSQFQRNRSFMDGLAQVNESFKKKFKITTRGMSRSRWADSSEALENDLQFKLPEDLELPTQKSDFRNMAGTCKASRDVCAQLFCAMLRCAGVDARLVCSLQPLPFNVNAKGATPQKSKPTMIIADPGSLAITSGDESEIGLQSDTSIITTGSIASTGTPERIRSRLATRLGRLPPNGINVSNGAVPAPVKKPRRKRIEESAYPIYWVEVFNAAAQKWIPIDPIVTNTISKPSKFEPPASDPENNMSYVLAFEDDGSARDVTRRYAKAYNAKTRRNRVEITKGGDKWWRRVMRVYKRSHDLDCDQIEDAELTAKEAAEAMPRSIQDFKDHPYYALERHLKRHEVVHPKREVGKVTAGKLAGNKGLEPIYRRRDVHMVKSADSWYRLGREVKPGEQPLKRVPARRNPDAALDDDNDDEAAAGTALYAAHQTTVYTPPPVLSSRIPKNAYGNLDIYTPSMVPPGGIHIPHPSTARAAKILGIDYADAVTGFSFKGRHGTAVIQGAVVAVECREAVETIIQKFEDEIAEAEEARRTFEALRMWRRLLAGLRIMERIGGYEIEGERDGVRIEMEKVDDDIEKEGDRGGGFLPDVDEEGLIEPTNGRMPATRHANDYVGEGGGFADDTFDAHLEAHDEEKGGGFIANSPSSHAASHDEDSPPSRHPTDHFINRIENDDRGGFYAYDIDEDAENAMHDVEGGGGFLDDESQEGDNGDGVMEVRAGDGTMEERPERDVGESVVGGDTNDNNDKIDKDESATIRHAETPNSFLPSLSSRPEPRAPEPAIPPPPRHPDPTAPIPPTSEPLASTAAGTPKTESSSDSELEEEREAREKEERECNDIAWQAEEVYRADQEWKRSQEVEMEFREEDEGESLLSHDPEDDESDEDDFEVCW